MNDWTLEEEKSLAILLSVIDIGGYGTKKEVLDNIYEKGYLNLDKHDLQYRPTLYELNWRNDLAFIRDNLKTYYIDGKTWNEWRITGKGKMAFCGMVYRYLKELAKPNHREPLKITKKWYKRVKEIIRKECPLMKDNIDIVLTPEVSKYIDDL
ncbi:MAG: hypothetical protein O8C62_08820 [Candidatus Methanoperedens sp.]|nr:hypothetical protein [Candidatus Methanoperedens sp.]